MIICHGSMESNLPVEMIHFLESVRYFYDSLLKAALHGKGYSSLKIKFNDENQWLASDCYQAFD